MALRRVQVTDVRCLQHAELELDPQFTLISGPNASGKTSLLEAIYLLGRGRSFRSRRLQPLIRTGAQRLRVVGDVAGAERAIRIGVEGEAGRLRARIGGERAGSVAELASVLPVQIIDPEVHRLIEEGPSLRRRFLDWGVFHVEPHYIPTWQRYHHALKQRNAALRNSWSTAAVTTWDGELIRAGEAVTEARQRYVERLRDAVGPVSRRVLGGEPELTYRRGWPQDLDLTAAVERSGPLDQETRSTQVGPHRAELVIRLDGALVRDRISRGQQKLLAASLLLAQLAVFPDDALPTLLLDDPAAELDAARLDALMGEVRRAPVQLIVTTLQQDVPGLQHPGCRFALNQGVLTPVD